MDVSLSVKSLVLQEMDVCVVVLQLVALQHEELQIIQVVNFSRLQQYELKLYSPLFIYSILEHFLKS